MLSILIPIYNYNASKLITVLHQYALDSKVSFEIIVIDDASTNSEISAQNASISDLLFCQYIILEKNIGRSKIRNLLASKASYDWLLFMDCDTFPQDTKYIENYLNAIHSNQSDVYFGGIVYQDERPTDDHLFRWVYGKKREAIPLQIRITKPHHYALTSNILIKKKIMLEHSFHGEITNYGFEDLVFVMELKKNGIPITHIENSSYHLNIEPSSVFLEKTHHSLNNLNFITEKGIINFEDTSLTQFYNKISKFKLQYLIIPFFKISQPLLKKNLLSKNPSLFIFDLYKLGYFCSIKNR
ncbi:glycosyltransferase family 2 protein [Flavobacterium sp. '19STA2R22 D10 B1']|uniref:glycosyltransferase family 2 protein n=1 Tax=Flavobacterium aerium TaxID=3037261 RepID=UPI00278C7990|nr:glycosyltransferase family 2 protein [Flavobacterium sp. '19STA2R22 D10 B1']